MFYLDAENFKRAKISQILIIINVFCFIAFNYILPEYYFYALVQNNYEIINNFEIWRLFSAMFLHADIIHLFSNMIALLLFGATVENSYTKTQYIVIYFVSGLIGNLFSLILLPLYSISLGASGAIFGLIGASFVIIAEDKTMILLGLVYIAYFLLMSFQPGINLWAHLFGLSSGIPLGYIFNRKHRKEREY